MPFERKDILLGAENPWCIFGDSYEAQIVSMRPGKNTKGQDVWKMTLIPTKELAKRFNITLDRLDENLTIQREYPIDLMIQLNSDPAWTRWFCYLNFDGELVPGVLGMKDFHESMKLQGLRRMNDSLKAENAFLSEKLEKALTNIAQFMKEHVMSVAQELNIATVLQNQQQGATSTQQTSPIRNY